MPIKSTKDSFQLIRHNLSRAEAASVEGRYKDAATFIKGTLQEIEDLIQHVEDLAMDQEGR